MERVWVSCCGLRVQEELNPYEPAGFWPVARAMGALGGWVSLDRAAFPHNGQPEAAMERLFAPFDFPITRSPATAQQASDALNGVLGGPIRTRRCLARAFLALFEPGARFELLHADTPPGSGVLVSDTRCLGLVFAEAPVLP